MKAESVPAANLESWGALSWIEPQFPVEVLQR